MRLMTQVKGLRLKVIGQLNDMRKTQEMVERNRRQDRKMVLLAQ
jgi:hypothetical protein